MRLALLIMGLALAAVMGLESFTVLNHPFASDAVSTAGGTGVIAALIMVVGAAFSLQYAVAAIAGFCLAALIAIVTGFTSPYGDLGIWGIGSAVLAMLALFIHIRTPAPLISSDAHLGTVASTSAATGQPTTLSPAVPALNHVPPGESNVVDQLERLGKLKASGALSEVEFSAMKASLFSGAPTRL